MPRAMPGKAILTAAIIMITPEPLPAAAPDLPGARRTDELLKLLIFLSPTFPVGAFSYSHGVECVIDSGGIRTPESLRDWLADLLEVGSGWNDAVLLTEAHHAAIAANWERLSAVAEIAEALAPSRERQLESMAQGRAFLETVAAAWPCHAAEVLLARDRAVYSVAVGAVAAGHAIALHDTLPAYLNAFLANLVSVGVRLIPIGQNAGQRIIASLHPPIADTAARAACSSLDDLGSATILSDIASMRHEEQYSRVFRT